MHIDAALRGRTVERALTDGQELILECTDGHRVRVTWDRGADSPRLVAVDVRVVLPGLGGLAGAGCIG